MTGDRERITESRGQLVLISTKLTVYSVEGARLWKESLLRSKHCHFGWCLIKLVWLTRTFKFIDMLTLIKTFKAAGAAWQVIRSIFITTP